MKKPFAMAVIFTVFLIGGLWLAKNKIPLGQTPTAGYLEGYMNVIDQCAPNLAKNIKCLAPREIYAQVKLEIYVKETGTFIKEVGFDAGGRYRAELLAGQYIAELNRVAPGTSADLPRNFLIEAGQPRYLNLNLVVK